MPSPSGATAKYGFPYPYEGDIPDIATALEELAQGVENIIATDFQNILSNRPAAGKTGRYFYAYDTLQLFRDNGTSWTQVGALPLQGLFSAMPAAGNQGALYFTTDTHILYRDNGTTWYTVMPAATTVTGPPAYGDSPVVGTDLPYARQGHSHGLPAAVARHVTKFNTSSTFLVPSTITLVDLFGVGGGAGGGLGGGGGGGQPISRLVAVVGGETITVTIGAGGVGGTTPSGAGTAGSNTTFVGSTSGTLLTCIGGGIATTGFGTPGGQNLWYDAGGGFAASPPPGYGAQGGIPPGGPEPLPGYGGGGGAAATYSTPPSNLGGGVSGGNGEIINTFPAAATAGAANTGGGGGGGTNSHNAGGGGSGYAEIKWIG